MSSDEDESFGDPYDVVFEDEDDGGSAGYRAGSGRAGIPALFTAMGSSIRWTSMGITASNSKITVT